MSSRPLRFLRASVPVTIPDVPADRTLLDLLRDDLGLRGTKEGCAEGDCGACTVVLAGLDGNTINYRAINSCIRLAHSVDGMALWSVEDIGSAEAPHPVQRAMVDCHASQCGFCTPGFVMSLFALYQGAACQSGALTVEGARQALSGNLCRCTGYRPILDAALQMGRYLQQPVDTAALAAQLRDLAQTTSQDSATPGASYLRPNTLAELLAQRAAHPRAQLVAGCTDAGLWVTKQHRRFAQVLDTTAVHELRQVRALADQTEIGAAVPLADAFDALCQRRPQLRSFADRFAGLPIRNSGTLGGNVANGSPIGDSMPLLIALRATVVLARLHVGQPALRELPLERLYTGYRTNVMAPDEVLAFIRVAHPAPGELMRVYKISKRFEDDISAVCLAIHLLVEDGVVRQASIGAGGVAATPVRAVRTEAALLGAPWNEATLTAAQAVLRSEFEPISDMRASAAYRREVLGALLQRFWLDCGTNTLHDLASLLVEPSP